MSNDGLLMGSDQERKARLVEIAKTDRLSRRDLETFFCKTEDEWRETAIEVIEMYKDRKEAQALGVALRSVLFPTVEDRTLGARREEFMKLHDISLSTMIRWERTGADLAARSWITAQINRTSVPTDEEVATLEDKLTRIDVEEFIARYDYYTELDATVDRLRLEVLDLKEKLAMRDKLLEQMRSLLNSPDDRD